jgi:hypothetical protein
MSDHCLYKGGLPTLRPTPNLGEQWNYAFSGSYPLTRPAWVALIGAQAPGHSSTQPEVHRTSLNIARTCRALTFPNNASLLPVKSLHISNTGQPRTAGAEPWWRVSSLLAESVAPTIGRRGWFIGIHTEEGSEQVGLDTRTDRLWFPECPAFAISVPYSHNYIGRIILK